MQMEGPAISQGVPKLTKRIKAAGDKNAMGKGSGSSQSDVFADEDDSNPKEEVASPAIREKGGAIAPARFKFQYNWALTELIERYKIGTEFCLGLEWHDDVVVANTAEKPTKFEFYQVKSKDPSSWTIHSLLAAPKENGEKKFSIVSKMAINLKNWEAMEVSASFVSNAAITVKDSNGKKIELPNSYSLQALPDIEKEKIVDHIKTNIEREIDIEKMFYKRTELGVRGHSDHTKGILAGFLEEYYKNAVPAVGPVYRVMMEEIVRRAEVEEVLIEFDQAVKRKFITRAKFQDMLHQFIPSLNPRENILSICNVLIQCAWDGRQIAQLKPFFDTYLIKVQDPIDLAFVKLIKEIRTLVDNLDPEEKFLDAETKVRSNLSCDYPCDPRLIRASILMEIWNHESKRQLPEIASELKDKVV